MMTKKKDAVEIKIKMNPWPFEKELRKRGLKSKEELEKVLFDQFDLNERMGDSLSVQVVKGKIKS